MSHFYQNIPNFLTLCNGLCGMLALLLAQQEHFVAAILSICLGTIFDALDGKVARFMGASSELGGQLDSLCDCITFGIAPATLVLFHLENILETIPLWGIASAAVYLSCVVWRLARFNVETTSDPEDHRYFKGLPSPLGAGLVCSTLWVIYTQKFFGTTSLYVLAFITLCTGFFMVSHLRFIHFIFYLSERLNSTQFLLLILSTLALCTLFHPLSWALLCPAFLLFNLGKLLLEFSKAEEEKEENELNLTSS